ncbi:MAG: membrane protein insertase YidC [Woeseia sp.]
MDNQRLLVWAAFGLMLWFTWQAWVQDYGAVPERQTEPATAEPRNQGEAPDHLPDLPAPAADAPQAGDPPALPDRAVDAGTQAATIRVRTDVLDVEISTLGGTLQEAALLEYPVAKDQPDVLVKLLSPGDPNFGLIQTGLRTAGEGPEPNHLAQFEADAREYRLGNENELVVSLRWDDGQGVNVLKQYRFRRGSYIIDVQQSVENNANREWRGAEYAQIQRFSTPQDRSMFDVDSYSFQGPILYDGEKSSKLDRDDLLSDGPLTLSAINGWIASIEHHFLSAIVPDPGVQHGYRVAVRDDVAIASVIGPARTIAAGGEETFSTVLFVGPKLQSQLDQVAPSLKLTVDYGWLTIISGPLFWLLSKVHGIVANWGLAIIIVTVLIKLVFYKLTEASGRSMAKMREIQPRMKALQERYKDDRQQLSQAMMELYKREKVNPAAGCLPILIQMPFFLAFYWVLLESVEMRQAPFALWITDLSSRDPFFILPLIMGAAMFFQQKLNPAPADPVQAKVMQIMPIVFTGFFAFFPSGLVLYWVTNTLLSIAQQWHINKVVGRESAKRKSAKKEVRKTEGGEAKKTGGKKKNRGKGAAKHDAAKKDETSESE